MATPAGGPVSAPPAVPAPALPSWPPATNPADHRDGPGGRGAVPPYPTSAPPAAARPVSGGPVGGRPVSVPYQGGPDLASVAYGGTDGPGFTTVSLPGHPAENTGSLTGHILAQGWSEDSRTTRSSTRRVVIVLAASLGLLVAISVLVVLLADDAVSGLTGNLLTK